MGTIYGRTIIKSYTKNKPYIPKTAKHEQNLQKQVCSYLRVQYPNVIFRSDFASGLHLSQYQANTHKSLQSSRAWPDLFIYQPMQHANKFYCGLAIELKKDGTPVILKTGSRKGHISSNPHIQEQAALLKDLNRLGYYANFCVGFDEAVKLIDWYFKKPTNSTMF